MTPRSLYDMVWAILAAVLVVWLAATMYPFAHRPRVLVRPSVLLARVLDNRVLRAALLLGWMWFGWHFFAR